MFKSRLDIMDCMHTIAVITVVYNNYADLSDFFSSFKKQTSGKFHIFVADLSTKPASYTWPAFCSVMTGPNKGYAYGLNLGLKEAMHDGYRQFVFMNNDTVVAEDFIESCQSALEKHPRALIGGKIYYAKDYEFHKGRYDKADLGNVLWYAGGVMDWKNAWSLHRGVDEVDQGQYNRVEETDFVTGCLMVFHENVVKKFGMIDESYFMYYEDTDWCARIKKRAGKLLYDPSIVIWHKNAQSTGGAGSRLHEKFLKRNHLIFGLRYAPFRIKLHLLLNFFMKK